MKPGVFVFLLAVAWPPAQATLQKPVTGESEDAIFVCGDDQRLPSPIPLRWSTVVLAGDGRLYVACTQKDAVHNMEDREVREMDVIARGLRSSLPEVRWRAVQAIVRFGCRSVGQMSICSGVSMVSGSLASGAPNTTQVQFGSPMTGALIHASQIQLACSARIQVIGGLQDLRRWQPGQLFRLLLDLSVDIRKEAAYALSVKLSDENIDPDLLKAAAEELRACVDREKDSSVQALLLEDLGLAHYGTNDDERTVAETFLVQQAHGESSRILGAMRGLEALIRQNPQRPIATATRERLRQLAVQGVESNDPRIRLFALLSLQTAGDIHPFTMMEVARDPDWQVRRVLAGRLNLLDPEQARLATQLENDEAFQVRYELLTPLGRLATSTGICAPIIRRLKDPSLIVQLQAMDLLSAKCTDLEETLPKLIDLAASLERQESHQQWHLPARALSALIRIKGDEARKYIAPALKHPVWQVRAAVASASVLVQDDAVALALVNDSEPNVRTAALDALFRLKSPSLVQEAIKVLNLADDFQLLRMAAYVLKGLKDDVKEEATQALLIALRRVTALKMDTSRDTRVAIIDRLAETMTADRTADLFPFLTDIDDDVIAAATRTFMALMPNAPPAFKLSRRYPFQPREEVITTLPGTAQITLADGVVELELLRDVAPVTVARFVMLANQGYYNGLTFHHVVPNFMVQGGSPGANDFSSILRFMRDEVGPQARHQRGAVGMSGQGRDAGDGQFFIDLVDLPSFDRTYTVFARVKSGMNLVDRLLDGAKIVGISFR